ncbi:MAG: hypothetical protein PVF77_15910 [Anaerolineae bacterium]
MDGEVVASGQVVASAVLDQWSGGDQWRLVGEVPLSLDDGAYARLSCEAMAGRQRQICAARTGF